MEEPRFFSGEADDILRCGLCSHSCAISSGSFGACGVRGNKNGKFLIPFYGLITALAVDPIEKKPLYHFRPGSKILSAGFAGCNLKCPFCQNWHISQCTKGNSEDTPQGKKMSPGDLVSAALHEDSMSIAYTYSEPLVHIEFLLDCMALAHKHGIANVLVTNGCINSEAAREVLELTDAANIDLKCFSAETYAKVLGGDLDSVLSFIKLALEKKVHVELTTLVVPGLNDSVEELDKCAAFIANLRAASLNAGSLGETQAVPWHLSAYHPEYRWNAPPTDPEFLLKIKKRVSNTLPFVYAGNIPGEENATPCPHCGKPLVRRFGYRVETKGLAPPAEGEGFFRCAHCGGKTGIRV
ncbi:MAG: AmmeMemoRadiSam system radical SAM enzyme [Treponema sp.]|jgi:pyruvate formate lyase activating enzyme|nr:AmmeMemoRadiSam system radical SAM enzyme [Treponema sp.]